MISEEFKNSYRTETYLGDGLYVHFDGYQFVLRAPREYFDHFVALEPSVFDALLEYRERAYADAQKIEKE